MSESLQDTQHSNTLSMYEVVGPMGRGAGSFVYKVKNRKTKQFAALKVIEKNCPNAEKIKQRIQNEIEVHSELQHANVVTLHAHFEDKDNYYLLLEVCEGGELYQIVKKKGRLSEAEVRNYGLQLAKGLQYLHGNRVIHRDLKLSNLLLTEQNVLKICDFGLAVKLTDLRSERDTLCGTPNYISPEVIRQESYGTKADSWAFGCILYAMATGNPPFEGDSVKDTLNKIQKGGFTLPSDISPSLQDLLNSLICWDAETRIGIDNVLTHPFFTTSTSSVFNKTRNFHPERLLISHSNSNSIPTEEITSIKRTLEINTKPKEDLSASAGYYPSVFAKQQLQQKSCSAASSPLLKKPPLASKKPPSSSQFSFAAGYANSDDKENLSVENLGDSMSSTSSQNKCELKKNQNSQRKNSNNTKIQPNGFLSNQSLQSVDSNILAQSNSSTRSGVSPTLFETNSSIDGDEVYNTKQLPNRNITPLTTQGLPPNKFKIKNGFFELAKNGWICLNISKTKRKISISSDGLTIQIEKCTPFKITKPYTLSTLPSKYLKFYSYASQVCETIKVQVQIPRVRVEDEEGRYSLSQTKPFPNFEAKFNTGERVSHTLSSEIMKIQMNDGRNYEINILEDASYLDEHLNFLVKTSLDKMNLCIQKVDSAP